MISSRIFACVVPAIFVVMPTQSTLAQYQALNETSQVAVEASEPFTWVVQSDGGEITLSGNVPYESVAALLSRRAGVEGEANLTVAEGAPLGFLRDALIAISAIENLEYGAIAYDGIGWVILGVRRDDETFDDLADVLGARLSQEPDVMDAATDGDGEVVQGSDSVAESVVDSVEELLEETSARSEALIENAEGEPIASGTESAPPRDAEVSPQEESSTSIHDVSGNGTATGQDQIETPTGISAEPGPVVEESEPVFPDASDTSAANDEAAVAQCREQMAGLMLGNPISFASGSTLPTASSEGVIANIAAVLDVCPSQPVYVEGHTDADGRTETNLVLSLNRAEAVVDRLVELGVDPQRLFAVGYGSSLPVASNETSSGKAENRRIVFSFEDIAQ
ncbi:OmpA family protein [Pelagibacterium sp.]|uniref:OmpA family protein n=1 Tax=Pelagibacterium sp. TaxID=1967288 RepID=UPI003A943179